MKEFFFRLKNASALEFMQSVLTAQVKEIITTEKHGPYSLKHYQDRNDRYIYCIGVSHPFFLPDGRTLDILRFRVSPLGDGLRVNVEYISDFAAYRPYLAALFREIAKDWPDAQAEISGIIAELTGQTLALTMPTDAKKQEPPAPDAPLSAHFDWYHAMRKAGYRVTLKNVAENAKLSPNHIRHEHQKYRFSHGIG